MDHVPCTAAATSIKRGSLWKEKKTQRIIEVLEVLPDLIKYWTVSFNGHTLNDSAKTRATVSNFLKRFTPEEKRFDPYEVIVRGRNLVIGYACRICNVFHSPQLYMAAEGRTPHDHARDAARDCCNKKCKECEIPIKKGEYMTCDWCRSVLDQRKQEKRFEDATKIASDDYEGFVWWDGKGPNDGYFESVADLLEYCYDEGHDPPVYVWACHQFNMKLDAGRILESALEDHHEEANLRDCDVTEMQDYFDSWLKKYGVTSWDYSYEMAVLIDEEQRQQVLRDIAGDEEMPF